MKFLALIMLLVISSANAASFKPVAQVRNVYASTNVTTSAYVTLISSTPNVVSAVEVFDSSGQTLQVAVGPVGNEVVQFQIVPGGNGLVSLLIPQGSRIAVKAISATASSGELDLNLFN